MRLRKIYQFKKLIFIFAIALVVSSCEQNTNKESALDQSENSKEYLQYVNPLMGTDSDFSLSNGNTYPAIATPWGMNFWTPMTSKMGDGWTYKYDEKTIRGIKQTHQPSPWINDYAAFSLMAVTGDLKYKEGERASHFSHKAETVKPDYYSVYLADYDVVAEVAPTERAAHFRFTFPETDEAYIMLDAFFKGSMVKILPEQRKIIGYCRNNSGGVPENFHNYFVAEFDKDFELTNTWGDDWKLEENTTENKGDHVGAIIGFKTKRGEAVHVKVASSFISPEQAQLNLDREIGNKSFKEIRSEATKAWEKELGRIEVSTQNIDHLRTFYSCLYRVLLFPRKFYEFDANEQVVHYSPYNGQVLPGYMFTDNGFWDTFRAVFPFFNMMYPELNSNIMEGLANTYKESGWLPEWASPGHRDCMIGSNSAPIIADAHLTGVTGFDKDLLLEAVIKNATTSEGRPVNSVGRAGVDYYNELGYVPYDVGINENAARTLEYAYADFTIAQMAKSLGDDKLAETYYKKSLNYKKLFDPTTNLMRGKNKDGQFQKPFNPLKWGDAFTEGNSLHYTWSVFHDVQGLMDLMGGDKEFVGMLDGVFNMPPEYDDSYYGFTIHEIREMQIMNMGNYAHGNQPIQHMIYLYNYAKQPWKTQSKVREVLTKLYTPAPDGYCGDEDNGQTSAWYVFSALGFYPVAPATNQYVIGSPLFSEAKLHLQNGNTFTITADGNGKDNPFIQSASLNSQSFNKTWIATETIQKGGNLHFEMTAEPNKNWAVSDDSLPYSLTNHID
ncbi:GH92 family glycosyl hydrolase [Flagellimonas sp. CMM7]|uniref:GH92 family glycosyl hydrolase n=1 Tax=Flagellimonas sp. CMM7 TaxID=2654676 RepID=UPI0013D3B84B|nr:GH92 family glycosyl hydrolase [Flagellimonas sp. CMM7]UII81157.1 GH92 family glycosyl hydrolase [Flagellimonas sp. CMM7]